MARLFDDASSEYLEVDSAAVSGAPCTLACWMYTDDAAANQVAMMVCDKDSANDRLYLAANGASGGDPIQAVHGATSGGVGGIASTSTGYSINTWHHACGVFASTISRTAYIDGGSSGNNTTLVGTWTGDRMSIARAGDSTPSAYFSGRIAEAAIWGAALSAAEIAILAKGFCPLFVSPENLLAYWPIVRGENDKVGGYDLTAYNTPTVANHPPIIYPAQPFYTVPAAAAPAGSEGPLVQGRLVRGGSLVGGGVLVR